MNLTPAEYKSAFEKYFRYGTPIELSLKKEQPTTHYIWRTRKDGKVRPSHTANDGKVFAWDDPPKTGAPGTEYGCRCIAEPFYPDIDEYLNFSFSNISDFSSPWSQQDFVDHYFNGNGKGVTVRQTGHLQAIVNRYRKLVIDVPSRLPTQIAQKARLSNSGNFTDNFKRSYDMENVVFSIGDTVIKGEISGNVSEENGVLSISGKIEFNLTDSFKDPADLIDLFDDEESEGNDDVEIINIPKTIVENIHRPLDNYLIGKPTGTISHGIRYGDPYPITDHWTGDFEGKVYSDPKKSSYT
ncbi:MAG: phage minor head protein [Pseudomonadota bacterium]